MPTFALILPAAGSSTRFGGPKNKLLEEVAGIPVLVRSLRVFLDRRDVAQIVIPTQAHLLEAAPASLRECLADPRVLLCAGGTSRADSVRKAVMQVDAGIEWVAVHDAARPLVSTGLIDRALAAAVDHGAAVPAMPVPFTIKQATGPLPARVERTLPRHTLWAMQTPQIMRRAALLSAFESCPLPLEQVTDDVQLIELAGGEVWLVPGEERNLKITTQTDLNIAEQIAAQDEAYGSFAPAVEAG